MHYYNALRDNYHYFQHIGDAFLESETPSSNPARIPPQTTPAGGKSAEAGQSKTPEKLFRPAESILIIWILLEIVSNFVQYTPHCTEFIGCVIILRNGKAN